MSATTRAARSSISFPSGPFAILPLQAGRRARAPLVDRMDGAQRDRAAPAGPGAGRSSGRTRAAASALNSGGSQFETKPQAHPLVLRCRAQLRGRAPRAPGRRRPRDPSDRRPGAQSRHARRGCARRGHRRRRAARPRSRRRRRPCGLRARPARRHHGDGRS